MIYADNAATTKISDRAYKQMLPFLREQYGNASSQYSLGKNAKRAVEAARRQFAVALGAEPTEIVFASGGSEINNWVIRNVIGSFPGEPSHIITSAIEHPSIMNACRVLENSGVEVTYLPVDRKGRVSIESLSAAIKPSTKLVSIMFGNNEIGTIQPIPEIGELLRGRKILFHTDAVQAVGHIPIDVRSLYVDFLTVSAHKFNGAKGTGILFMRAGLSLSPLIFGGEQEHGLRAGTENVAGIVAAGCAIEESVSNIAEVTQTLNKMVNATVSGIQEQIPCIRINGDKENSLPGIVNLCFEDISGESLMHLLDLKKIYISTSSACNSGKDEPSHVLLAIGLNEKNAKSSIRISYGRFNTMEDVSAIVSAMCDAYKKIKESM